MNKTLTCINKMITNQILRDPLDIEGFAIIQDKKKKESTLYTTPDPISRYSGLSKDVSRIRTGTLQLSADSLEEILHSDRQIPAGDFFHSIQKYRAQRVEEARQESLKKGEKYVPLFYVVAQTHPEVFDLLCHTTRSTEKWWLKLPLKGEAYDSFGNPVKGMGVTLAYKHFQNWSINPNLRISKDIEYLFLPIQGPYEGMTMAIDQKGRLFEVITKNQ